MNTCQKVYAPAGVWEFIGAYQNLLQTGSLICTYQYPDLVVRANFLANGVVDPGNIPSCVYSANIPVTETITDTSFLLTTQGVSSVSAAPGKCRVRWQLFFWLPISLDFTKKWRLQFDAEAEFFQQANLAANISTITGYYFVDPQGGPFTFASLVATRSPSSLLLSGLPVAGVTTVNQHFDEVIDSGGVPLGLNLECEFTMQYTVPGPTYSPAMYFRYTGLTLEEVP